MMIDLQLEANIEHWPIAGDFRISRSSKTQATVIVATLSDGNIEGRGECVPYARYGETVEGVQGAILTMSEALQVGLDRQELLRQMPSGAARNAIDCALWDYEAKLFNTSAVKLAKLKPLSAVETAYTISLDTPQAMADIAASKAHFPLLKLKLGATGDDDRLRAIRKAAPKARLIIDANEGWTKVAIENLISISKETGVELIEQPLPAGDDALLAEIAHLVPICADESIHERVDLPALKDRYDAVNIKLDKAGGLTEALAMVEDAKALDMKVMVGCMVGTSLAMAPAFLLTSKADWVDLDGPLLLASDRAPGLIYQDALVQPPSPALWG